MDPSHEHFHNRPPPNDVSPQLISELRDFVSRSNPTSWDLKVIENQEGIVTEGTGPGAKQHNCRFQVRTMVIPCEPGRSMSISAYSYSDPSRANPHEAQKLNWKLSQSHDEKETVLTAFQDEFKIELRKLERAEILGQPLVTFSATISLKDTLVGPITLDGKTAERLFEHVAKLRKG